MNLGLLPIKRKDHRTYDFHRTFGSVSPEIIPQEFNFDLAGQAGIFPNQDADGLPNGCTAYTENDIASNEDQLGYYDDQAFTYENTKRIGGAAGDVPVSILDALKEGTVYGVKKKSETPQQALIHRRGPYFIVKATTDKFDGLISAMWQKQGGLSVGTPWLLACHLVGKDGIVPSFATPKTFTSGHCWEACGVKLMNGEQRVICKSWQGVEYGDKGYCYFNRKQINDLLSVPGSGAFGQKQATPEDIRTVKMSIIETLISFLHLLVEKMINNRQTSIPDLPVAPAPVQPQPVASTAKYDWSSLSAVRHSLRVICDEEGLTLEQKNTLCATIEAESGFDTKAVHQNYVVKNGIKTLASTDFGLCQWNDIYHGKEISSEEALNNPEKAVRLMCAYWKRGQRNLWIAYSSGAYKKYL